MELCGMFCSCCLSLSVDYNAFFNWRLMKATGNGNDCKFVLSSVCLRTLSPKTTKDTAIFYWPCTANINPLSTCIFCSFSPPHAVYYFLKVRSTWENLCKHEYIPFFGDHFILSCTLLLCWIQQYCLEKLEAGHFWDFKVNSCILTTYKWLNHNLDMTDHPCFLLADGSLFTYLQELNQRLSDKEAMNIFIQVLKAVCYLHSLGIIHKDLKGKISYQRCLLCIFVYYYCYYCCCCCYYYYYCCCYYYYYYYIIIIIFIIILLAGV